MLKCMSIAFAIYVLELNPVFVCWIEPLIKKNTCCSMPIMESRYR